MNATGWINAVGLLVLALLLWARWAQLDLPAYPVCWLNTEGPECWAFAAPPAGSVRHER